MSIHSASPPRPTCMVRGKLLRSSPALWRGPPCGDPHPRDLILPPRPDSSFLVSIWLRLPTLSAPLCFPIALGTRCTPAGSAQAGRAPTLHRLPLSLQPALSDVPVLLWLLRRGSVMPESARVERGNVRVNVPGSGASLSALEPHITCYLCDLGQVTRPLCSSFFTFIT